jgi:flagellar assembly protein FliH
MAKKSLGGWTIEPFDYAGPDSAPDSDCGNWEIEEVDEKGAALRRAEERGAARAEAVVAPGVDFERRLEEEVRRAFDAGRERGRQEGRAAERELLAAERQERAAQLGRLAEAFAEERDRYLNSVEQEVVKLALAVAARVLRREAQMDPLLLLGAVRVALGQLADSTQVRLRVPAADVAMWTEAVALLPGSGPKPQVAAGEGMRLGDCAVETEMGSADLGVRAQLSEIERGFFDRAARIPAPERAA